MHVVMRNMYSWSSKYPLVNIEWVANKWDTAVSNGLIPELGSVACPGFEKGKIDDEIERRVRRIEEKERQRYTWF